MSFRIEVGQGQYEESIIGVVLLYNLISNEISSFLQTYELTPAKFKVLMIIKHQGKLRGFSAFGFKLIKTEQSIFDNLIVKWIGKIKSC